MVTTSSPAMMMNLLRGVCLTILFAFSVNCGKFDLENGNGEIPNTWLKKLEDLRLQDKMESSIRSAKREFQMSLDLENYVLGTGIHVHKGSTSYGLLLDNSPTESALELDKAANLMLKLSSHFVYSECITHGVPHKFCSQFISRLVIPQDSEIYRNCSAITGRSKDAPGQPYRRLLPADYSDGLYKIHKHHLPNPRNVSNQFYEAALERINEIVHDWDYSPEGKLDRSRSVFFVQWSQFIEQDMVHTVQHSHYNGQPVQCCNGNQVAAPRSTSTSCSPIHVSDKDPHYKQFVLRCLDYVRSAITVNPECKLGAINQLNLASDHLDLSQIYGVTKEMENNLQLHRDGMLKSDSKHLLTSTHHNCLKSDSCFCSGDSRVNFSPYMVAQHSIFLRSHNKIAEELKKLNSHWTDDQIYVTAKKINRAIFQKITYKEWLPMVIGNDLGFRVRTNNEEVTGTPRGVSNEFATAAIRFYNSMLPGDLFEDSGLAPKKLFELRHNFYQPRNLNWTETFRTRILSSALRQKAMALDTSYVDDLSVDLFRAKNGHDDDRESGTDSLALDIMRSRDHGLPGYVHYLNACRRGSHAEVAAWEQLEQRFRPKDLELLRKIYRHVEDIDLIVGAIAELPENDSLVGPTFSCIIAEQMDKTRRSDPNFYQRDERLRQTVQNYSAANLLCDTMDLTSVQADVFQIPSRLGRNPIMACDQLGNALDLEPWRNAGV